jgi:hypothetical protein
LENNEDEGLTVVPCPNMQASTCRRGNFQLFPPSKETSFFQAAVAVEKNSIKMAMVGGIGAGVFVILFFGAISVIVCCFGSCSRRPQYVSGLV